MTLLSELAGQIKDCRLCPLGDLRENAVPGEGSQSCGLMLVGEAPGFYEDKAGRPFIGAAGKLLTQFLAEIGLPREEVFITNIVKCRPPQNRNPQAEEIAACRPYLLKQIELLAPRLVIILGNFALNSLLKEKLSISLVHGKIFKKEGVTYFPTYHPAAALYTRKLEEVIRKDFAQLKKLLKKVEV